MNLKLILKKFKHQKTITLLRIISMGLGMGGALVLFYIVMNNFRKDRFLPEHNRIYQVFAYYNSPTRSLTSTSIWEPVVPAMVSDFPQIECGTVTRYDGINDFKKDESLMPAQTLYADSSFFSVFERRFLYGNKKHSLSRLNTAVVTKSFAQRLYQNESNAIGKVILLNQTRPIQITGVIEDWPDNSSFNTDVIISFATLKDEKRLYMGWNGGDSFQGYVKLAKNVSASEIDKAISAFQKKYYDVAAEKAGGFSMTFKLISLTKASFTADPAQKKALSIMILIGVLVLGLAIFNSLLLILSSRQKFHKEIFIQRTMGASNFDIQKFILKETLVYMMASLLVAIAFIFLINPFIESNYEINLIHTFLNGTFELLTVFIFLISFVVIYWIPARWTTRYFSTTQQSQHVARTPVNAFMQRALLTLQIGISISLLIFLWVIQNQFNYISHFDQGYNPNNLIYINLQNEKLYAKDQVIKSEIAKLPNVLSACLSTEIPAHGLSGNYFTKTPEKKNVKDFRNIVVGPEFFKTLDIPLSGRTFKPGTVNKNDVVITKKVARIFGLKSPIGKTIYRYGRPYTIIGVVHDIVSGSLHRAIEPIVFNLYHTPSVYSTLTIRINSNQAENTVRQIKRTINKIVPGQVVQVNYYDSDIMENYEQDIAMKKTISFFALFAAFITLAGLIGFTTTLIEKRTKELGIRKINGASEQALVFLLNRTFVINVVIAIVVFVPISYHVAKIWLQNFAYAVSLHAWIFAMIAILVSVLVLAVVTVFTLKAARRNPAKTLRYE